MLAPTPPTIRRDRSICAACGLRSKARLKTRHLGLVAAGPFLSPARFAPHGPARRQSSRPAPPPPRCRTRPPTPNQASSAPFERGALVVGGRLGFVGRLLRWRSRTGWSAAGDQAAEPRPSQGGS